MNGNYSIIRTFLFVLFLINQQITTSQISYSKFIYNDSTKNPISWVNIGIKGKNIGTVSNSEGFFKIYIPKERMEDSITFSSVGYYRHTVSVKDLIHVETDSLFLSPKIRELPIIDVLKKGKWKSKDYGLSRHLSGAYGIVQSERFNDIVECAQQVELGDELVKISKFNIYLKSVNTDTALFRINFYRMDDTIPGKNVFEREIIIKQKISNGWLEIDLNSFNVWLHGDVLASIEFLPSHRQKKKISLYYGGIIVCKGSSYNRVSSQGDWYKLNFGTYSIFITTKKFIPKK
jgi:CarboxypepD_reg-like domain